MNRRRTPYAAAALLLLAAAYPPTVSSQVSVGTGHSPAAEAGPGIDLLVWHDGSAIRASRMTPTGAPLDVPALTLGPARSPVAPDPAWDGAAFVVAWMDGGSLGIGRVFPDGRMEGPAMHPIAAEVLDVAIAGRGGGAARVVTAPHSVELSVQNGVPQPPADGGREGSVSDVALEWSLDRWDYAWIGRSEVSGCEAEPGCVFLEGARGTRVVSDSASAGTLVSTSRGRAIFGWAADGDRAELHLLRPEPEGDVRSVLRFPFPLEIQNGAGLFAFGGPVRALLGEDLALREATLFETAADESIGAVLPHSGLPIVSAATGSGPLTARIADGSRFDVAISPVFVAADLAWVKIENRGPASPEDVHLWVSGPVRAFSSARHGDIVQRGATSWIRFDGLFHKGAGFEVVLTFDEPVDPDGFEAWTFASGTDLDATNNRMGPAIEAPPAPAPPPARRRVARRGVE